MPNPNIYDQQTARLFGVFRIIFGAYLAWHFAALLPYASELFGPAGIFTAAHPSPFHGKWPNPLFFSQWPPLAGVMIGAGILASVLLCVGRLRRSSALYLWFLSTCLFTANPLIANPSLGYTGLLLLLTALVPLGEPYVLKKERDTNWKMPFMISIAAWVLLAAGYTFSGYMKLSCPSWIDGSALSHVLENPLARPNFLRDILLSLPEQIMQLLTWSTLALEIAFIPLVLFRKVRPWAWLAMVSMHLSIMLVIDFADLSLGMLMIHLFTYNPRWLPARQSTSSSPHILFIDGDCSFCQRSTRVLMLCDPHQVLRFAPLQGSTAEQLPEECLLTGNDQSDAIVLLENPQQPDSKTWRGADAALRSLYLSGGPVSLLWIFHHLPTRLKKTTYQWIAKRRLKLSSNCQLPTPAQRKLFLP